MLGAPFADGRELATKLPAGTKVVLDPPRAGVGALIMERLLAIRPRAIAYVACDPASLARDVRTALDHGWRLTRLQAFDAFPMTHHIECIATLCCELQ